MKVFFNKFHRRTNVMTFLVTILGSRNQNKYTVLKFDILRVPPIQIPTKKVKPCFLSKFRCRTKSMHFLLPMRQVYTHPTSASDFFEIFYKDFHYYLLLQNLEAIFGKT
jgi:hypothetical protein